MKYSEILKVDETFQYSINLQFDINNIKKIKEYIPTKDSCEVIEKYIDSIYGNFSKSTTLIGPYGKGKSHLLLVLMAILSDYNEEHINEINNLIQKIKVLNESLYEKIISIRSSHLRYMPIIINSNYNNMNQAFLLGLNEALERENIKDLVINTYYEVANDVLSKWEEDAELKDKLFKALDEKKVTLNALRNSLKMYDEKYYGIFKEIYLDLMHGIEFNPLINSDLIKLFKDVNYKISEKGYNGLLIVFDEFSKFLEYVSNESMMKDLKLLQDFAELSSRTGKKEQILFTCITHKTINEYIKNLKEDKINAFKTVEGRFKDIYFNRSMEQNYEMVSQTIKRSNNFKEYFNSYYHQNIAFFNEIKENFAFLNFEKSEKILFEGCFPLNPVTVFSMINLSEKIAQNERTLFTFLTDDDVYSFKYFINNYSGADLFNVDRIYDYFYNLFKKDTDESIRKCWVKADSSLAKLDNDLDKKIIKVLAIIYMINDYNFLVPNLKTIKLSLNLDNQTIETHINSLLEKGIIKYKKTNKTFDFSSVYNKEIVDEINNLINSKFYNINIRSVLNKIIDLGYVIPRRYNQEYKMTRFLKNIYLLDSELMNLKTLNIIKKDYFSDGFVWNIIIKNESIKNIENKVKELNDDESIFRISNNPFSDEIEYSLREYEAIEYILNTKNIEEELLLEVEQIKNELIEYIQNEIQKMYETKNIKELLYIEEKFKDTNISSLSSDICEKIYCKTPIINNEMINKEEISSPIFKARNIVMDAILKEDMDLIKSETSAEATIYKATISKKENNDIADIIKIIREYIKKSEGNERKSFNKIVEKLIKKPYGIRKGLLPILLTIVLNEYKDRIVFYYKNKEIELESNNISKIVDDSENYYIVLENGTEDKNIFVSNLLELYKVEASEQYRDNVKKIVEEMKKWVLAFPRIVRDLTTNGFKDGELNYILFKNELLIPDLNNNEFLFFKLKELFKINDFKSLFTEIEKAKNYFDSYTEKYKNKVIEETKEILEHKSKSNLNILLKKWYENIDSKAKKMVVKLETKQLMDYVDNLATFNENEIVENLAFIICGRYIEDWQNNTLEEFSIKLSKTMEELNNVDISKENISETITISAGDKEIIKYLDSSEISLLGNTMKNNIEDLIDEYGDSINETEKIKVVLEILKKYL